jgi:surface antigen
VAGLISGRAQPLQYRPSLGLRLIAGARKPLGTIAVVLLALSSGGCSFQLGSMFEQGGDDLRGRPTASVAPGPQQASRAEADASLRAAASELFTHNDPNTSLPWTNPKTGARGTVTPVADAYTQAGVTCRDFLASYIQGETEDWLQGEACREPPGHWEVRRLKPWSRS